MTTAAFRGPAPAFIAGAAAFTATALVLMVGSSAAPPQGGSLKESPENAGMAAGASLQKARVTGEPRFYVEAEKAIARGLALDPKNPIVLTQAASLAASRHDFTRAERIARTAGTGSAASAILVDALVQQARLDDAAAELQSLIDRKPSSGAYARASYLRQLGGDLRGAREAMLLAISASGDASQDAALLQDHLAEVEILAGRPEAARRAYRTALARYPELTGPQLGLARLDAANGHVARAMDRVQAVLAAGPDPEASLLLGEMHLAAGREAAASKAFEAVEADRRRHIAAGAKTDGEWAEFEADHGDPVRAVAMARRSYAGREGVHVADALGWALTRAGRPEAALPYAREAISIDPTDPHTRYHAGMAAAAAGRPAMARRELRLALSRPEVLGPLHVQWARRALR